MSRGQETNDHAQQWWKSLSYDEKDLIAFELFPKVPVSTLDDNEIEDLFSHMLEKLAANEDNII